MQTQFSALARLGGDVAGSRNDAGLIDLVGFGTTTRSRLLPAATATATSSVNRGAASDGHGQQRSRLHACADSEPDCRWSSARCADHRPGTRPASSVRRSPPFDLTATGGTSPYTGRATGLPAGSTDGPTGQITGTPSHRRRHRHRDGHRLGDRQRAGTDDETFAWHVTAAAAVTPIADIQGTGATSPLDGQTVTTQGVVTASYPTGGLNGFYIQTPGADTANASDAIFVYGGATGFATYPAVGDSVEVTGTGRRVLRRHPGRRAATRASAPSRLSARSTAKTVIPGTDCALPGTDCLSAAALDDAREVAEGELFQPTAPWTATDVYDGGPFYSDGTNSSAFRGELGVVANSTKPLVAPTEVIDAQATALVAERNEVQRRAPDHPRRRRRA